MTRNLFRLFRDPTATDGDRIAQLSGRPVIEKRERITGESLLHVCARRGLLPEAVRLIELGADVNAGTALKVTPLIYASLENHISIVKLLVSSGAQINANSAHSGNALSNAVFRGNNQVVQFLIEQGADVKQRDRFSGTLMHVAAIRGNSDLIQMLANEGVNCNEPGLNGELPIHLAAQWRNVSAVEGLLQAGADINAPDKSGTTALDFTRILGLSEMEAFLTARGAKGRPRKI